MDYFNPELWERIKAAVQRRKEGMFPEGGLEAEHWYWRELEYQYRAYFEPPMKHCCCCKR